MNWNETNHEHQGLSDKLEARVSHENRNLVASLCMWTLGGSRIGHKPTLSGKIQKRSVLVLYRRKLTKKDSHYN